MNIATRPAGMLILALLTCEPALALYDPPLPSARMLRVENTTTYPRNGEIVISGVPLARSQAVYEISSLAIVDAAGEAVPATFRVLARWHAGRDQLAAPIQWLLVSFRADLPAASTRTFRLIDDGSVANPAPTAALIASAAAGGVDIDTGVATFRIGSDGALHRAMPVGAAELVTSAEVDLLIAGQAVTAVGVVRHVELVRSGALDAVVVAEAELAIPTIDGGAMVLTRRYEFRAGSNVARVRAWLTWEGDRCGRGVLACNGQPNGVLVERWRERLTPAVGAGSSVGMLATVGAPVSSAPYALGQSVHLRQRRRGQRSDPYLYQQQWPNGTNASGALADGGVLTLQGSSGLLSVALAAMHRHEPQALRVLADGAIALDLADDGFWLGARQAAHVEYAIAVQAPGATHEDGVAAVWPLLNAPLLALPDPSWAAATGALEEFPAGPLPPQWQPYDTLVEQTLDRTIELRRSLGMYGLMTDGLYPRNWGDPLLADELDCGNDPTPGTAWDNTYWCATWTDYHNASATAVVSALRHGDVRRLHEIAFPAARRMLHTQIIQCAPGDPYFYCGQAPAGYGGYRADDNGSHAYFDNLMLYYWLSGDETVSRTLQRGATSMRAFLCPARAGATPGPMCVATDPITDPWAALNGRSASQWYAAFRFVGLTSDDASFLDDWTGNSARWLTQNYADLVQSDRRFGFITRSGGGAMDIIPGPGQYFNDQLWMASLYDFNLLYRLQRDSGDLPLGQPALTPLAIQRHWAHTLQAASLLPPGNGSAAGVWPNMLRFAFTGPRVDGTLTTLSPGWSPGPMPQPCFDDCLYDAGKASLAAAVLRGADAGGDPGLRALGADLAMHGLAWLATAPRPLGKETGIALARLHAAIARLSSGDRLFNNGFEAQ